MESMETDTMPSPVKQAGRSGPTNNLHVWYFGSKAIHRTTLEGLNFNEVTLTKLKELALERKPDGIPATTVNDIDILYNGRVVLAENPDETPLESLNVKENTVVHVVKKIGKDGRQAKFDQFQNEPPKPVPKSTVSELALALKTMILSPNFFNAIDKLSDPQTLRNVLAVVPNLRHDPVGLAVIQDPAMILYLADEENLNILATSRPWVVEALNFIAAGIHQHESSTGGRAPSLASSRTPGLHSLLSYMRQIEDEDDDDRPEGAGGLGAGSSQRRQITREQLSSALEAFQNLSRGAGNPLLSTLAGPSGNRPAAAGPATPRMPADPLSMAASLARSASQAAGANTSPLSGDMVARAVRDAINQLPPDQRAAQIDAFRSLAMQLGGAGGGTPATPSPAPAPTTAQAQPQQNPTSAGSGSVPSQYSEQLAQMREMGIFDERLSLMALRVSEGDVATAVELVFSGWQGEGLE